MLFLCLQVASSQDVKDTSGLNPPLVKPETLAPQSAPDPTGQAPSPKGAGAGANSAPSFPLITRNPKSYSQDRIIVQYKSSARPGRGHRYGVEKTRPGESPQQAIQRVQRRPDVEYAELDYEVSMTQSYIPTEYNPSQTWGLDKTNATGAWSISTGRQVTVCVIGMCHISSAKAKNAWSPGLYIKSRALK